MEKTECGREARKKEKIQGKNRSTVGVDVFFSLDDTVT